MLKVRPATKRDLPEVLSLLNAVSRRERYGGRPLGPVINKKFKARFSKALKLWPLGLLVAEDEANNIKAALTTRRLNKHVLGAKLLSFGEGRELRHEENGRIVLLDGLFGLGAGRKVTSETIRQIEQLMPLGVEEFGAVAGGEARERLYKSIGFERAGPSLNKLVPLRKAVRRE